jgi:hypothetical protein
LRGVPCTLALVVAWIAVTDTSNKAEAATLSIVGGTVGGALPSNFNPAGWPSPNGVDDGSPITVFDSSNDEVGETGYGGLYVSPTSVTLRFTYLGKEAGNTNEAQIGFNNQVLFNTTNASVGDSVDVSFGAGDIAGDPGLVPFLFQTLSEYTGGVVKTAVNGGLINDPLSIAFSAVFGNTVYAFFGDGYGDHDFDDMTIAISVVPIPPALLMFASGLAGLGLLARRHARRGRADTVRVARWTPMAGSRT